MLCEIKKINTKLRWKLQELKKKLFFKYLRIDKKKKERCFFILTYVCLKLKKTNDTFVWCRSGGIISGTLRRT